MATLGNTYSTLSDHAKRIDPDGKIPMIVELLSRRLPVLQDMPFMEANDVYGHRSTVRTALPPATWRKINKGVAHSKSRTAQMIESIGIQEQRSFIDENHPGALADLNAFRLSEAAPHIESIAQEFESTLFYGSATTNAEEFTGLSSRFNSLTAENGQNIIDAGGTGSDNTSVWLVVYEPDRTLFGIYPKGSQAGIEHEDLGKQQIEDSDGNRLGGYEDKWVHRAGIVLKDWRFVARTCNVDVSNLVAESSAADLAKELIRMTHLVQSVEMGKAFIYMNRTVAAAFDVQDLVNVRGGGITVEMIDGKPRLHFRGIPIRVTDSITNAESRVT